MQALFRSLGTLSNFAQANFKTLVKGFKISPHIEIFAQDYFNLNHEKKILLSPYANVGSETPISYFYSTFGALRAAVQRALRSLPSYSIPYLAGATVPFFLNLLARKFHGTLFFK